MKSPWGEGRGGLLTAVGSGVLLGAAFPKIGLSLAAFVGLLPLLTAIQLPGAPREETVRPRRAFVLGYITGVVFFLILLHWIPRLPAENVTIPYFMYPALLLMVAYLALYPALAAWGTAWLARRGVPAGIAMAVLWTLLEAVRGTGTFGFPWGSLGYAFAPVPHLIQFAEYTGVWGVTLWVVLLNGCLHFYLATRRPRVKFVMLGAVAALLAGPYIHGHQVFQNAPLRPAVRVGSIQPNTGNNKWDPGTRQAVAHALLAQTEALANDTQRRPPELMVWPETAIPVRLPRDPYYLDMVNTLVDTTGIPLLAGYPDGYRTEDGDARFTNSAGLFLPGRGLVHQYDKRHLVPFSEYFPLPLLRRYDFGQSSFAVGETSGEFTQLNPPFGVMICFESIFPGISRELAASGVKYFVNITNDQWFGDSAAPIQHFHMNVLRCIENRMGMVRVANTGISAVIDPQGVVHDATGTFVEDRRVMTVDLGGTLTIYSWAGDWILAVCGAGLLACVAGAWWGRRRETA